MTDLSNIIIGLKCTRGTRDEFDCTKCYYGNKRGCYRPILDDAIAVIESYKAKSPIWKERIVPVFEEYEDGTGAIDCLECGDGGSMTLQEAIQHLKETLADSNHEWGCEECKKEHEQLLEWLKELQSYKSYTYRTIIKESKLTKYQCNKCKYYEGVHCVQGHAPCSYWGISGVMWNDYCSHFSYLTNLKNDKRKQGDLSNA